MTGNVIIKQIIAIARPENKNWKMIVVFKSETHFARLITINPFPQSDSKSLPRKQEVIYFV
jgi:hypothetical protein